MTRTNNESINTMNKNLSAIFKGLNLSALPKLESEMKTKKELNQEIILRTFPHWKQYASTKQARQTVEYFYTLSLYQSSIRSIIKDTLNEYKTEDEELNAIIEDFIKKLTSKALTLLKQGNNLNSYINSMMKAYFAKEKDMETFNLYFNRFFGFTPSEKDLRDIDILLIDDKGITGNQKFIGKLVNIFTVLQANTGCFSEKSVKTTFKKTTQSIMIVDKEEFFKEDGQTVRENYLYYLLDKYKVPYKTDESASDIQKKANKVAKKHCIAIPKELQKTDITSLFEKVETSETKKEESATK